MIKLQDPIQALINEQLALIKKEFKAHQKITKTEIWSEHIECQQQTFFNWQKTKPKLVRVIWGGIFYQKIEKAIALIIAAQELEELAAERNKDA